VDGGVTLKLIKVDISSSSCTSLKITPSSATLTVNQLSPVMTSPSQVTVVAELQPSGCFPATTPVLWSIDRTDIAIIDSTGHLSLVTPISTPIVITGHSGTFTGTATVQVSVNVADNHLAPPFDELLLCSQVGRGRTYLVRLRAIRGAGNIFDWFCHQFRECAVANQRS
jgi:hypothetical protein